MARATLDLGNVDACEREPGDPGVAPRTEADHHRGRGVLGEARSRDAGSSEVLAGPLGARVFVPVAHDGGDELARLAVLRDALEEGSKVRMDRDVAHAVARLRALQLSRAFVPCFRDVNDAGVEVDVSPRESAQLAGAEVEVAGERVQLAPVAWYVLAREERSDFVRVDEGASPRLASFGRKDVRAWIVGADTQIAALRHARRAECGCHDNPDVARTLGAYPFGSARTAVKEDRLVERVADPFDVVTGDASDRKVADVRRDPFLPGANVVLAAASAKVGAVGVEALTVHRAGLAVQRIALAVFLLQASALRSE